MSSQPTGFADHIVQLDYDGSDNVIYYGLASPGSATSAAVWQIKKLTYAGSNLTSMRWANGAKTFANVWDNRAALSYS